MKRFVTNYSEKITGVISCFDRMLFRGFLPIGWGDAMGRFLSSRGVLVKDFGKTSCMPMEERLK